MVDHLAYVTFFVGAKKVTKETPVEFETLPSILSVDTFKFSSGGVFREAIVSV